MSEFSAATIRAAREAKVKELTRPGDPRQKVDASDWTPPPAMDTERKTGAQPHPRAYKAGGAVSHGHAGRKPRGFEGSPKDVREDKSLAKKHGMSMKSWEASAMDEKHDAQKSTAGLARGGNYDGGTRPTGGRIARAHGGSCSCAKCSGGRVARAAGGGAPEFVPIPKNKLMGSGLQKYLDRSNSDEEMSRVVKSARTHGLNVPSHLSDVEGYRKGGRVARATGGRAKSKHGKTNIVIAINPGAGAQPMAPPPGMIPPPGDVLPPMKPMGTMPAPSAGPAGGMPAGGPPMPAGAVPRKSGGRAYRTYKDMDAGALSGKGRLEKTAIQRGR